MNKNLALEIDCWSDNIAVDICCFIFLCFTKVEKQISGNIFACACNNISIKRLNAIVNIMNHITFFFLNLILSVPSKTLENEERYIMIILYKNVTVETKLAIW